MLCAWIDLIVSTLQSRPHDLLYIHTLPGEYVRKRTSGFSWARTPISAFLAARVALYMAKLGRYLIASMEVIWTTFLSPDVNLDKKSDVRTLMEVKLTPIVSCSELGSVCSLIGLEMSPRVPALWTITNCLCLASSIFETHSEKTLWSEFKSPRSAKTGCAVMPGHVFWISSRTSLSFSLLRASSTRSLWAPV